MLRCAWVLVLGLLACRFDTSGLRPGPEPNARDSAVDRGRMDRRQDLARSDRDQTDRPAPLRDTAGDGAPLDQTPPKDKLPKDKLPKDKLPDLQSPDSKLGLGTTCSSPGQCASGFCVDKTSRGGKVCCTQSCNGCDGCHSDGDGCSC